MLFVKLFSIILILIILLKLKTDITLSLFILSVYSVFIFNIDPHTSVKAALQILKAPDSLRLYVIIVSVLYISKIQQKKNMFDKLVNSLNHILREKKRVAMVGPAIIGFLPMPGGALVSAPLVEETTKDLHLKSEFKTFMNYWFRHIWEFVWPIYAGLLLFQTMSGIPMKKIVLLQSPYTILNILSGIIVTVLYMKKNRIKKQKIIARSGIKSMISDFFAGVWPVAVIIVLFFLFSIPLYIALLITSVLLTVVKKISIRDILKILFSKLIFKTVVLIATVLIFQEIISISQIFNYLGGEHLSLGILILFSFGISFSLGFLTGVNTAYIAIAFPVMLPIIRSSSHFVQLSIYLYVIGFAGILLSPVHLCLVLSNEYFGSNLVKVYRYLIPPVVIMMTAATIVVIFF